DIARRHAGAVHRTLTLHRRSPRSARRLLCIDRGALPEAVLERELFRREHEALDGADVSDRGLLEAADGGTVYWPRGRFLELCPATGSRLALASTPSSSSASWAPSRCSSTEQPTAR